MGLRYGQGKYSTFKYGPSDAGFQFRVQLSDSAGVLQVLLNNEVVSLDWNYKANGGCGKFKCVLKRSFDDLVGLTASHRREIYDLQVWITPDFGETTALYYRGCVKSIRPSLSDSEQIVIDGVGYSERLKDLIAHDGTGAPKEYTSSTISGVLTSLFNDFVDGVAPITLGDVDTFSTAVVSIKFNDSVWDAITKLADIVGAEWGVDRNRELYFLIPETDPGDYWMIGRDIGEIEDEFDYSQIVNQVLIEGGDIDDGTGSGDTVPFRYIKTDQASIDCFGLKQKRVNNSSVVDSTVADRLASSVIEKYKSYLRNMSVTLPFNKSLIEDAVPLQRPVIGDDTMPLKHKYAEIQYGGGATGGKYSGTVHQRIDSIAYSLKDASLETYIELNYGKPDITNRFEELAFNLDQQRQAAGV